MWHDAWSRLINYFYDGRILSMGEIRNHIRHEASAFSASKIAEPWVSRVLSQLVSGVATRSQFKHAVLHHTCRHLIQDKTQLGRNRIYSALSQSQLNEITAIKSIKSDSLVNEAAA